MATHNKTTQKVTKMKFFGKNKELAEEIAVGGAPSPEHEQDAELAPAGAVKHTTTPGADDIQEKGAESTDDTNSLEKIPSADAQAGVRKVEAVTLTWSKKDLYIAYGWCVLSPPYSPPNNNIRTNLHAASS